MEDEPVAKKQHMQQPTSAFPTHQGIYINEQGKQVRMRAISGPVNKELGCFEQQVKHFLSNEYLFKPVVIHFKRKCYIVHGIE